ncbi:ribose ABC transporter permease [Mangrovactinospora gilvigrisea]|uniref:Xylose transport system permease protein XylH n=1 Tax=Mangrovactinospora gilvigrisea TaxID=1428644 RepID=A0A1J7BJ60_9ACTN|nr:ABC transporter permease [Mangrovactinospora gilvigrisea]OIV38621.1 ribose ABC transporter permease [Mangrovactinospora gilvigrisea]
MSAGSTAVVPELARPPRLVDRLVARPEIGSLLGAVLVFVFFTLITDQFLTVKGVSNWLDDASTLGIMAVTVAMLMIGGEFDLSTGVNTASTGLVTGILATQAHWNVWLALLVSLVFALLVGLVNGLLVVRTGLPSFIITLGMFLALQGLNLGVTRAVTGNVQISGVGAAHGYESAGYFLASTFRIGGTPFPVSILWWIGATALLSGVLLKTRFGNWVFAAGGAPLQARAVGVPVRSTKVALFMLTGLGAWLVGNINVLRYTTVQANQGIGLELQYIVAAVIGGCLMTGGFGSVVGAAIGALLFGMVRQGIVFADWNSDWFMLFLGVLLLVAVLANDVFRRRAERMRR